MRADEGQSDAVEHLVRAAAGVSAVAPAVAVELYGQALAMVGPGDPRALGIEVACLEPLARAGNIIAARARGEALLARTADAADRRTVERGLAAVSATAGDLARSTELYRAAADPEGRPDGEVGDEALRTCLAESQAVLFGGDPANVVVAMERALATSADPRVHCVAHQGLALAAGAVGDYDAAHAHALAAFARFDPRTLPRAGFVIPDIWVGSFDAFRDRFDEATAIFERVGYEAERRGELPVLVHTGAALGMVAFFGARPDDAAREMELVLALSAETGARAQDVAAHAVLAAIALDRGDRTAAERHLDLGREALAVGAHLFGVDLLVWVEARLLEDDGRPEAALARLGELWAMTATLRGLTQFRTIAPDLVRLARAAGSTALARTVAADVEQLAARAGTASARAAAARCRALADGDDDGLATAAALLDGSPWKLDLARLRGAATSRGPRPGLSTREGEVVELVRHGHTNPEIADQLFISRRTVESHVASAMRKLGAANRTQLAVLAARAPVSPG